MIKVIWINVLTWKHVPSACNHPLNAHKLLKVKSCSDCFVQYSQGDTVIEIISNYTCSFPWFTLNSSHIANFRCTQDNELKCNRMENSTIAHYTNQFPQNLIMLQVHVLKQQSRMWLRLYIKDIYVIMNAHFLETTSY